MGFASHEDIIILEEDKMESNIHPVEQHKRNLARVDKRIRHLVYDFCRQNLGKTFFMYELEYSVLQERMITPGSAGRLLRLLKKEKTINYQQISRNESKYRITYVSGAHQMSMPW